VLKIEAIDTYYGSLHILKKVDLRVADGELVTVIGTNGAGKTTMLRTISGVVPPANGSIEYHGKKINGLSPSDIVKTGICQVPEGGEVFDIMSVKENLEMGAYLRRDKQDVAEDLERIYRLFPRLKDRLKQQAGTLSGGEQRMLAISRGLMSKPKLLILDEPSLGLSPVLVEAIMTTIVEIRDEHAIGVLLVEQNANIALQLADRGYVLELGRIVLEGSGKELLEDGGVRKAYLGI
jgi:branched-chain amino acid transport system ATP-binding protein